MATGENFAFLLLQIWLNTLRIRYIFVWIRIRIQIQIRNNVINYGICSSYWIRIRICVPNTDPDP